MVENGELLSDICTDRDMPLAGTFLRWCREDQQLAERYRDALEIGTDVTFDEAVSNAFDADVGRASVRWRALMTRAERQMPEKYGPRATLTNKPGKEDETGGIDYAGDVRRRLSAMAERLAAPADTGGEQSS